jgi:hypothetical protein
MRSTLLRRGEHTPGAKKLRCFMGLGRPRLPVWFFADVRSPFGKPDLADWPCA